MRFYKNTLKIGGTDLTVVTVNQEEGEIVQETKVMTPSQVHHIHILDRSGSMAGHIHQLVTQVQRTLDLLQPDDLISIVWFSGQGEYRTLVKGAKKSPELINLLNSLRSVYGTTCFSDPTKEVKAIVEELSPLCPTISVTLFTDGCPVTPWSSSEEEKRTQDLVLSFKDKVIAFNTVGYGNYYNQDFLKNLAAASEFGIFTHSRDIEEYYNIFQNNFERISEGVVQSVHIEYGLNIEGIYLNRKFAKMETLEMYLSRLDKNKNQFFLVSKTGDFSFIYNDTQFLSKDIQEESAEPTIKNFLYAYASCLYYKNKRRESLEVLAHLRDKALLDSHMAAFTFDEAAGHQALLEKAIFSTSARNVAGESKANYLPAKNAFCVYDVLNILAKENAFYLPFHDEAASYNRIGKKAEDAQKLFEKTSDPIYTPFSDFVFNKEKANLSVRIYIPGTVTINPREAREVNLPEKFESNIWRNHTFIKDGNLNIKKCVVLLPEKTYNEILSRRKILELLDDKEDKALAAKVGAEYGEKYVVCKLFFSRLPVINASYNEEVSASRIFDICSKILAEECYQKYLNSYWKNWEAKATVSQKKVGAFEGLLAEQIKVLENHGIDKTGAYVGLAKTPKNAECDFYETRNFEFVFKGISSLPSIKEVNEKVAAKKITISVSKMNEAYLRLVEDSRKAGIDLQSPVVKTRDWFVEQIKETKYNLFCMRAEICALKMAKLLNGDNFEGFESDGKKNLCFTRGDETLYLKMDRVKEYY